MNESTDVVKPKKSKRGFASMSKEKQRAIASKGGKVAHAQGLAHKWTAAEARAAGRKGGKAVVEKFGIEHFERIGANGGAKRAEQRRAARTNT